MLDFFKSHYKNFGKFVIVGIINTSVDFFVFYLLYQYLNIYFLLAHICAFLSAAANSFILNSLWTFKSLDKDKILKQVLLFLLVAVSALIVSSAVIYFLSFYINVYIAKILAVAVSLIWNYIGLLFVFIRKK